MPIMTQDAPAAADVFMCHSDIITLHSWLSVYSPVDLVKNGAESSLRASDTLHVCFRNTLSMLVF